jgi:uncharacterized protein YbcI
MPQIVAAVRWRRLRGDIVSEVSRSGELWTDIGKAHSITTLEASNNSAEIAGLLSRRLVQLLRERSGRGPVRAETHWAGADALVTLFSGGYTKAESTLRNHGRIGTARAYRQALLDALQADARALVEQATGRTVSAFLSCTHHEPDVTAVIFLLEPLGGSDSDEAGMRGAGSAAAPRTTFPPSDGDGPPPHAA